MKHALFSSFIIIISALSLAGCQGTAQNAAQSTATAPGGGDSTEVPPPSLPEASYPATVSQEIAIPMADGIRLAATVTFPSEDGANPAPGLFPVVLSVTPYSRNGVCGCPSRELFAERGIIGVTVDARGTGGSEGNLNENYFSPLEASDTVAMIEYFGTQDYSNGKVGMAGGSYVGITQLLAAAQQPEHLAAIAPQIPLSDVYRDAYTHGGIINLFFDVQYIAVQGGPGLAGSNTDPALLEMSVLGKIQQLTGTPIMFDYLEHPLDDDFYRDRSPIYVADQIQVPVLLIGGWRDGLSQRGNPELFHVLSQRPGVETRMVMDPCTHKGCGAPFAPLTNPEGLDNLSALIFEFLSHYLIDAQVPQRKPVRVFVQGAEHYMEAQQWPPESTQLKRLYLDQGSLQINAPEAASNAEYFTNPAAGLSTSFEQYGTVAGSPFIPLDQRLEIGQGLTWRGDVLSEPLSLIGPSMLHLVASSSAADTDWIVKLADVAADGSETLITSGYLRASHRALDAARTRPGVPYHPHIDPQPLVAGQNEVFEIEILPTAYELASGHRLQIRLTSVDIPTHAPVSIAFDRSQPLATQIELMAPAINRVAEGGEDASYLLIPHFVDSNAH